MSRTSDPVSGDGRAPARNPAGKRHQAAPVIPELEISGAGAPESDTQKILWHIATVAQTCHTLSEA